jgi:hypothetical protein
MPGLVPGIHVLVCARPIPKTWMASEVGLARLPNWDEYRKSGHDVEFPADEARNNELLQTHFLVGRIDEVVGVGF